MRVDDALAGRSAVVNRTGSRVLPQVTLRLEQRMQARREREAVLGEIDRGAKELRPRQAAMAPVGKLEHAQHARHADRAPAEHRLVERDGLPLGIQEPLAPRRGRRGLAPVVAAQPLLALRPVQQEGTTADAGRFGLHQPEHQLHGDRGIDSRAAAREHVVARLRGERVCRRHHELARDERIARLCDAGGENEKGGRGRLFHGAGEHRQTISGTMSSATMLMILMSGLTAGPAVSL